MPSINLTLTDTPAGGVSVATSFRPAISHPCSPAQSYALEILARTREDLGLPRADVERIDAAIAKAGGAA